MKEQLLHTIETPLGKCDVFLGSNLLGELQSLDCVRNATGIALICDRNTDRLFRESLEAKIRDARPFARAAFAPGEEHKTLDTARSLLDLFAKAHLDRGTVVIAVGGGVVTDLAGFVASIYLRGVPWVAAPTTVLAMADAAIGGKTGVDLPEGKNLAGTIHPPRAVVADLRTLESLPPRDRRGGLAEIVKIAMAADEKFFAELEARGAELCVCPPGALEPVLRRAIEIKAKIVELDERSTSATRPPTRSRPQPNTNDSTTARPLRSACASPARSRCAAECCQRIRRAASPLSSMRSAFPTICPRISTRKRFLRLRCTTRRRPRDRCVLFYQRSSAPPRSRLSLPTSSSPR
jgi:hypothetical protein